MKYLLIAAVVVSMPTLVFAHTVGQAGDNVSTGHANAGNATAAVTNSRGKVGFHPDTTKVGKPSE